MLQLYYAYGLCSLCYFTSNLTSTTMFCVMSALYQVDNKFIIEKELVI